MLCFCCSDVALQPIFPQIIIANESVFKASEFLELLAATPPNVYLIRQKSAWNNKAVMQRLVTLLKQILEPYLEEYYFIFGMDAAGCHITDETMQAWHRAGLAFILVPAKLTFLLQVLDTHGFRRWKSYVRKEYQRRRSEIADESPALPISVFLEVLYAAIRHIIQGTRWEQAFLQDGWGGSQRCVSKYIKTWLGVKDVPHISSNMPAIEDIKNLFPGGNKTYRYDLCAPRPAPPPALPPPPPLPALPPPQLPPALRVRPLFIRRPTAQHIPGSSGAASSSALPSAVPEATEASSQQWQTGPQTRSQTRRLLSLEESGD